MQLRTWLDTEDTDRNVQDVHDATFINFKIFEKY